MRIYRKIIIVLSLLLLPIFVNAEVKKLVTYVGYTEEYVTMEWDLVNDNPATMEINEGADYYKIKMKHFERGVEIARGRVDHPGNQVSLSFPYGGHYIIQVTSCKNNVDDPDNPYCSQDCTTDDPPLCTEKWSSSDDPSVAVVDGQAQGWWIYKYISPPGGGAVE